MYCFLTFVGVVLLIVLLIKLLTGDCDLTLQFFERFGSSPDSLKGKVVWITGASSGIGKSLAIDLARVGCRLVLSARRNNLLEIVKNECLKNASGLDERDILLVPMDVKEYSSHQKCVDTVLTHFKAIDILVNNAGRSLRADWDKVAVAVDEELFQVNVFGLMSLTRLVLPHMLERNDGQIVVTSSVAGKLGAPNSGAYSGTKFALHGYFDALKVEKLLSTNVTVTMVCPGPVISEVRKNAMTESIDKSYGIEMEGNEPLIMKTERCSQLMAVAMANKLDEVWISKQPVLLFVYGMQYAPSITRFTAKLLGSKALKKMRDSTVDTHLKDK